jgi:hypothetical protein
MMTGTSKDKKNTFDRSKTLHTFGTGAVAPVAPLRDSNVVCELRKFGVICASGSH